MRTIPILLSALSLMIASGCVVSQPTLLAENRNGVAVTSFKKGETPMLAVENLPPNTECTIKILHQPDNVLVKTSHRQSGADFSSPSPDLNAPAPAYFHHLVVSDLADLREGDYSAELWTNGRLRDHVKFTVAGNWESR